MDNEVLKERYELALERISRLRKEIRDGESGIPEKFCPFCEKQAELLFMIKKVVDTPELCANKAFNESLYADIKGYAYESSFCEPEYAHRQFGEKLAPSFNWVAVKMRDVIPAAYSGDVWTVVVCAELFLEMVSTLCTSDESELKGHLKEMIYYFVHDYDEVRFEKRITSFITPNDGLIRNIIMKSNLDDPDYLYRYGANISENEILLSKYLSKLPETKLIDMARTYTEGYKKGFEVAGINLSKKKTVEIRYPIGLEAVVRESVKQFEQMGLKATFRDVSNIENLCVTTTPANRQYLYDHRYDDALYLNSAMASDKLAIARKIFEKYSDEAYTYAGPAVIESFGEDQYIPVKKENAPKYTKEQEKVSIEYKRDYALMQDEFIPGDKRSYTIIAYPIPEIGDDFEDIFEETVTINTLDSEKYQRIHQYIIDALDTGEYVRIKGKGANKTDMKVMLHKLDDPAKQTNFENCVADVNIPVGEVFTSPVLTGTEGVLNVSYVYLNGLRYDDLEISFKNGKVEGYTCKNFDDEEKNKAYIKENILFDHDTLPIGEFAIGTNTTAYVMARKYHIEDKLPILIAEKTGPHFALGDTCYSMSEDVKLYNPDGKEIIAKENECSALRKTAPEKAYFQCHTDITIPFEELESIIVFTKDKNETIILRDGLFVLEGTEELNSVLEEKKNA